jgi:hypothetical protein
VRIVPSQDGLYRGEPSNVSREPTFHSCKLPCHCVENSINVSFLDILFAHLIREIFGSAHRESEDGHRWVLPTATHKASSIDNE